MIEQNDTEVHMTAKIHSCQFTIALILEPIALPLIIRDLYFFSRPMSTQISVTAMMSRERFFFYLCSMYHNAT